MADCPGHEELQKLISDPPAPEREQSLERHLETCEHCRQRLEALADLRDVVPDRPVRVRLPESPALKRAMEHFQADPNSQEAVVGVPALAGGSQSDWLKPGLQPTLPFLQPTDRPGFLGKLGPYELRRLIGRGGMGMVFEGFDPALKRTVAVKVMDPLLAMSDQARSRFLREARAAAALTHENIVTIHAVDQADSVLFVVLQYVSGESVADRLRREVRLPFADVVRLGVQVARGLAAAHEKGLVHRDIKPGNLLHEAGTDRVKIADFGLVKTAGEDALTVEGTIAGTPEFMSPEQARGTGVDARSDLFSLGAVLYTACTGMSPFRGDSPLHTLERVCRESPIPLGQFDPTLPEWFCNVVHRLLEKEPIRRFPSAAELAEALERPEAALTASAPEGNRPASRLARGRFGWRKLVAGFVVLAAVITAAVGTHLGRPDVNGHEPNRTPEIGFMIAGRTATFRHLAEALQAAADGDVIEVYGDGPFPTPPLRTEGKRLTIRAAGQSKPLFLPEAPGQRSTQPFISADADLRLEGLDIRWTLEPSPGKSEAEMLSRCVLISTRGRMTLTHCRVVANKRKGCVGGSGQHLVLHNCHLVASNGTSVFWRPTDGSSLSVEGCALEAQSALAVYAVAETARPRSAQLSLAQNTLTAEHALHLYVDTTPRQPLSIVARHTLFDSAQLVVLRALRPLRKIDRSPAQVRQLLRSFGGWSDEANVYRRGMDYVVAAEGPRMPASLSAGIQDLGQWLRLWDVPPKQSVEGVIKYQERAGGTSLRPLQLAGVANSSGPVPARPGAQADALGPGTAYHTWRASPAYHSRLAPATRP